MANARPLKRIAKIVALVLAISVALSVPIIAFKFGHPDPPPVADYLRKSPARDGRLSVQFFGTTSLAFRDGRNTIMIDGYLSRPGLWSVLRRPLSSDRSVIDRTLRKAGIGKVDLLLVSHSHLDHALDAAMIAQKTGARLVGSLSTRQIGLGGGLPDDRIQVIVPGETMTVGDFAVTAFQSLHSPDDRVPGTIRAPLHQPARASDYKQGGTFSFLIVHRGVRILVHPSANVVPGMYRHVRADVIFLATGGLGAQSDSQVADYWKQVVETTGAKLVIPIHRDDFLRPLDAPMLPMRRFMDDYDKAMLRVKPLAARDRVAIRFMPVIDPVDIAAAQRPARPE
jgi:L-ascorbate metabolism protein UlaG (beta-lactamase superfamily)